MRRVLPRLPADRSGLQRLRGKRVRRTSCPAFATTGATVTAAVAAGTARPASLLQQLDLHRVRGVLPGLPADRGSLQRLRESRVRRTCPAFAATGTSGAVRSSFGSLACCMLPVARDWDSTLAVGNLISCLTKC